MCFIPEFRDAQSYVDFYRRFFGAGPDGGGECEVVFSVAEALVSYERYRSYTRGVCERNCDGDSSGRASVRGLACSPGGLMVVSSPAGGGALKESNSSGRVADCDAYSSTYKGTVSQSCRDIQFGCFPGVGSVVGDEHDVVPVVADGGVDSAATGVVGAKRGKNFERNLRKKQNRKLNRSADVPVWRASAGPDNAGRAFGDSDSVQSRKGFWNSCTESVRMRLIESKAKMHVAENERKEAEAKARVQYLNSPEALLRKAVDLQLFAEKQAAAVANERVGGWAKTVANASAENLARSAPSSVPSFDEVVKELDSISQAEAERVRVAYQTERDAIEAKVDAVQSEKDAVQAEKDALLAEKNAVDLRVATLLEKISSLEVAKASQASSETLVNARIAQLESELVVRRKAGDLDYKAKFFKVSHEKCALEEKLARISSDPVMPVRRTIPVKKGWFGN